MEFIFDDTLPSSVVQQELRQYLSESDRRFEGAEVYANFGRRLLNPAELQGLIDLFQEHDVSVAEISASREALEQAITEPFSVPVVLDGRSRKQGRAGEQRQPDTLLIKHSCRTGTSIHHRGDVVVLGNVNPGAEIAATGDVIVMGALKGMVHAGADGNQQAMVITLSLQATQLRIAGLIAMGASPGPKAGSPVGAEIAYVKGGAILVEPYAGVLPVQAQSPIPVNGG